METSSRSDDARPCLPKGMSDDFYRNFAPEQWACSAMSYRCRCDGRHVEVINLIFRRLTISQMILDPDSLGQTNLAAILTFAFLAFFRNTRCSTCRQRRFETLDLAEADCT